MTARLLNAPALVEDKHHHHEDHEEI